MEFKWVIGAVLQLVGSLIINLGVNLMKLGHTIKLKNIMIKGEKAIYTYWQWNLGWLAFGLGNVMCFSSYAFASQAMLTALGSVQFVSNVLYGRWLLGEKISLRAVTAAGFILPGNILVVAFASKDDPLFSSQQLQELYRAHQFVIYLSAACCAAIVTFLWSRYGLRRQADSSKSPTKFWMKSTPVAYSICSGLIGAQAVLFSTSLSILARQTFAGSNELANWFTAVLIVGFLLGAAVWVARLNKGLQFFDAAVIIPMNQIVWILLTMVSGNLYFQEFNRFSQLQLIMFGSGMALLLLGIYCLIPGGKGNSGSDTKPQLQGDAQVSIQRVGNDCVLERSKEDDSRHLQSIRDSSQFSSRVISSLQNINLPAVLLLPRRRMLALFQELEVLPTSEKEAQIFEQTLRQLAHVQSPPGVQNLQIPEDSLLQATCHSHPPAALPVNLRQELQALQQAPLQQTEGLLTKKQLSGYSHRTQTQPLHDLCTSVQPCRKQSYKNSTNRIPSQDTEEHGQLNDMHGAQHSLHIVQPGIQGSFKGAGCRVYENALYDDMKQRTEALVLHALPEANGCESSIHPIAPAYEVSAAYHQTYQAGAADSSEAPSTSKRRGSIARLAAAAQGAASSLRRSLVCTVDLMAGLGENEHQQPFSIFAVPMVAYK